MNAPEKATATRHSSSQGFVFGIAAYALWGVLPIYFKALRDIPATDIVAHRVLWSLPFLGILIAVGRGWDKLKRTLGQLKRAVEHERLRGEAARRRATR